MISALVLHWPVEVAERGPIDYLPELAPHSFPIWRSACQWFLFAVLVFLLES